MKFKIKNITYSLGKLSLTAVLSFMFLSYYAPQKTLAVQTDSTKSVIIKQNDLTPLDILRGDTNKVDIDKYKYDPMPGDIGNKTLPIQDSNYYRALRLHIPHSARLAYDLRRFSPLIPGKSDKAFQSDIANDALNLPPEYYMPLNVDLANYQYNYLMSQNNVTGIRTINPFGLKISLNSIGQFLGFVKDVSPVIVYELDYRTEVQVLIYSVGAKVVATIFEGVQPPGKYKYTWNGRDDNGRKMPPGDYIAEVRIGKNRYLRKHIIIK